MDWRNIAILAVLAASPLDSILYAYPVPVDFDGSLLRWANATVETPIYFEVVNDSSYDSAAATTMVASGAALWSAVQGSNLRLENSADTAGAAAKITVNFNSAFDGGSYAAAYASMDEYDLDGNPAHCSIQVAIRGGERSNDLEKTILHELGHCLGLGHSLFPKAIMSYRTEENAFALDVDDATALRRLYPEDGLGANIPPGCTIGRPGRTQHPDRPQRNKSPSSGVPRPIDPLIALLPLIAWLTGRRLRG